MVVGSRLVVRISTKLGDVDSRRIFADESPLLGRVFGYFLLTSFGRLVGNARGYNRGDV
jgi:hypothetical protein